MTLVELIYKRLAGNEGITRHLAEYNGHPAVFYQNIPKDNETGWENSQGFPRICYRFAFKAGSGAVWTRAVCITVYYGSNMDYLSQIIESEIMDLFHNVLAAPDGSSLYFLNNHKTEALNFDGQRVDSFGRNKNWCNIWFDLMEYPQQETGEPDPVRGFNEYIKKIWPNSFAAGFDRGEDFILTDGPDIVFYCTPASVKKGRETNTAVWMEGELVIYIICPSASVRLKKITELANRLSLDGEVLMPDGAPVLIRNLQADNTADYLKKGQLFVSVEYGLLRYRSTPEKLKNINIHI